MNITTFSAKELQVIQLIVPEMTPEATCNAVLRSWFDSQVQRMRVAVKTQDAAVDEIIAVKAQEVAQDKAVVKPVI